MAKTPNSSRDVSKSKKRTVRKTSDDRVVIGSEIGVSIPIGDTFAHLRFSFWSERFAKSDSRADIRKTAEEVDEFNERELDRRLQKHIKTVKAALREMYDDDDDEEEASEPKGSKVSVRDRAKARLK